MGSGISHVPFSCDTNPANPLAQDESPKAAKAETFKMFPVGNAPVAIAFEVLQFGWRIILATP